MLHVLDNDLSAMTDANEDVQECFIPFKPLKQHNYTKHVGIENHQVLNARLRKLCFHSTFQMGVNYLIEFTETYTDKNRYIGGQRAATNLTVDTLKWALKSLST